MPNNNELWINPTTEHLRFKTGDSITTAFSNNVYPAAAETIIKGNAIALNSSGKITKLDTSVHPRCIGVALNGNSGVADVDIEVATLGDLRGLAVTDLFSTAYPNTDPIDATDLGTIVYASSEAGKYTLSLENAIINDRIVVELGIIVAYDSALGTFSIDVNVQGDHRGPLGATKVEYTLAEETFLANNSGSFPPKVYAIGTVSGTETFKEEIYLKAPSDTPGGGAPGAPASSNLDKQYIIFYNGRWAAAFYFFLTAGTGTGAAGLVSGGNTGIPTALQADLDSICPRAYQSAFGILYTTGSAFYTDGTGTTVTGLLISAMITAANNGKLHQSSSYAFLQNVNSSGSWSSTSNVSSTNTASTFSNIARFVIEATAARQVFTMYSKNSVSPYTRDMNGFLDLTQTVNTRRGYQDSLGKAIIADNTNDLKLNVIGFLSNEPASIQLVSSYSGIFQKMGVISGFSGLSPGSLIFLGSPISPSNYPTAAGVNYTLANSSNILTSLVGAKSYNQVQLGIAKSSSVIDINIGVATEAPNLDYPTGAILKLPVGRSTADSGFLLCNGSSGITTASGDVYTEYLTYLNNVTGSSYSLTGGVTVPVPNIPGYQIKVQRYGGVPRYPSAFVYSKQLTWSDLTYSGTDASTPYTSGGLVKGTNTLTYKLNYTNALGQMLQTLEFSTGNLSKLLIKMFITKAAGSFIELQPGIITLNGPSYAGFTITDGFISGSPNNFIANINFYCATATPVSTSTPLFGYLDPANPATLTAFGSGDILTINAYRAENFEYFVLPDLYKLKSFQTDVASAIATLKSQVYFSNMGAYL